MILSSLFSQEFTRRFMPRRFRKQNAARRLYNPYVLVPVLKNHVYPNAVLSSSSIQE